MAPGEAIMWHRQIQWIDPIDAASRLAGLGGVSLLDSAMPHETLGRYSTLAADPFGIFQVRDGGSLWNGCLEHGKPMDALRARLALYPNDIIAGLPPFQGGAIGAFAYEFGWQLEGLIPPATRFVDDIHLAFYDTIVAFDHTTHACWIIASGHPAETGTARHARALARLDAFDALLSSASAKPRPHPEIVWRPTLSRDAYRERVRRVQDYIRAGDIYQANIAQRFVATAPTGGDPWTLYRYLRAANPAPFGAYLDLGARQILSTSPELFLRMREGRVETRPIKGTTKRLGDPIADASARASLLASRKDRAENVMIVDLLRNDLSRVCEAPSVCVPTLCGLESYSGLHHLVSVVTGTLRYDRDGLDLIAASFPGGSITGAPKRRAMEIIAEIEGCSRGIYCGAIGGIGFDGTIDLNIAIRTVVVEGGTMDFRVGGGITLLSDPDTEYEETLTKARRIFDAFSPGVRVPAEACA